MNGTIADTIAGATSICRATGEPSVRDLAHGLWSRLTRVVELPELDHALQKTEKSLIMYAVMMHSASRRIVPAVLIAVVLAVPTAAQEFAAGEPIGAAQ